VCVTSEVRLYFPVCVRVCVCGTRGSRVLYCCVIRSTGPRSIRSSPRDVQDTHTRVAPYTKLEKSTDKKSRHRFQRGQLCFIPSPAWTWLTPVLSPPRAPHTDLGVPTLFQIIPSIGKQFSPFNFALDVRNTSRSHLR
ncbi:unnamed protein product, partial [Ectocarpus sp. 12 AP-2014]